jgi:hypothetical protein
MRFTILTCLIVSSIFISFSCQRDSTVSDDQSTEPENQAEQMVADTLIRIAKDFLLSWEPPFYEEESLKDFSKSDDFSMVIDGSYLGSYQEWASILPESMEHERLHYKSYTHHIKELRTVVLGPNAGAITITYVWDNVTDEDEHYKTDGAITLVCREEADRWKIVHYHGSHDKEVLQP